MNIIEFINNLLGDPPEGFEFLPYVIAGVFALSLVELVFEMFRRMATMFGSR